MNETKLEPVILLLFIGMVFFTAMLFTAEHYFPMDGQMFQVIAGLLTGFSGAFFMRVKPKSAANSNDDPVDTNPSNGVTDEKKLQS